ncbi:MAG TPA: FAD-binding oxidoreductase [Panacibacter sp.]|nr:FAD-binding oxidoreductase [Panacibacter sp.]
MLNKIPRKDFLKLSLLAGIGVFGTQRNLFEDDFFYQPATNVVYYKKGDAEYDLLRKGFNKRIDKYPAVIALCKNTQGIAEAINYAKQNFLSVTIKSGGHCMEGFSCNNDGMVINLSLLKSIEWIDANTVKIQPACTLSQLYDELLPKKKMIPGGSCAGVGIGGLTLGGGYGLMSRRYGLTCDSLTEVTMVDGNGQIRNSANDPDLLWACKGGGNGNFGVISEMKFKVHDAPATLQSVRFRTHNVTVAKAKSLMQQWFLLTETLPQSAFSAFLLNGKTVYILLTNSEAHTAETKKIIASLSKISETTSTSLPKEISAALKVYYGQTQPVYFKNASAGLYKSFDDIAPFIETVIQTVINTPRMIYQVNTLGGNIQNPDFAAASSFPHRDYIYFSELQTYWEVPSKSEKLIKQFEAVQQIFRQNNIKAQYRNYPDINFENPQELYYGDNYQRLQQLKLKYDPQNLIRGEQSIKV